jgi:hypothetical protein
MGDGYMQVRHRKEAAEHLLVIPERFKDSTLESNRPRNHQKEKALILMRVTVGLV